MPANTAPLNEAVGKNATYKTVPGQYYNPQTDAYEVTQGSGGAPNVRFVEASAQGAAAITPNDSTDLAKVTRGLYVGTGGDIKITMADGSVVTRKNVAGGITHPWAVKRIWATGTTAADLIGDY
ncbi:hypothetical protein [Paenibacillus sp. P22]|uniref:spike base protein, RCAP_Rcc01079 family n=1 Tax=Paenibacillus sp. P22 TaxID=483908 RepID=UPI0003903CC1|nr:hypothetical protein [Paenibacillus sp. P22]CDN42081.1 hypothetical protein BN871_AT_00830 [Paenibacillus sp. P22]